MTTTERRALFIVAPHHQGGHSVPGEVIAFVLGIGFPVRMQELEAKAIAEGLDPAELWPWYCKKGGGK